MPTELDHFFIWVSAGGAEAGSLTSFGLTEGAPNQHPGQGTACRRFFFRNAYLELLWVEDPAEARLETVRPLFFWERWSGRQQGACPFGFCFRPGPASQPNDHPPFPSWAYSPPYLPEGMSFLVGNNVGTLTEPALFYLPFGRCPDTHPRQKRELLEHKRGLCEITRIELASPHVNPASPEIRALGDLKLLPQRQEPDFEVTVGFDEELQGQGVSFQPILPLAFRW